MGRILEFITFYQNALHLTRVHCATFDLYQSAFATNNSNKSTSMVCCRHANFKVAAIYSLSSTHEFKLQFPHLWIVAICIILCPNRSLVHHPHVIAENCKHLYNAVSIVGHMFFRWDEMRQSRALTAKTILVFLEYKWCRVRSR